MTDDLLIGRLPKAFIGLAFFNFLIGAGLGGFMASLPRLWPTLGSVHGEINPYGWLTLLIYGMTYAVLTVSAGLRPPWAWLVWMHLFVAELAVFAVVTGFLFQLDFLLQSGFGLQALAPLLFLFNILSAVFTSRRGVFTKRAAPRRDESERNGEVVSEFAFLGRSPTYTVTDRIAQRGTDLALMIFVAAAGWIAFNVILGTEPRSAGESAATTILVYYGWIAGTVLAVWLHLFPRLFGVSCISNRFAVMGQGIWCVSLLLLVIGLEWVPAVATAGSRILGISFIWSAACYLVLFHKQGLGAGKIQHLPSQSVLASYASWWFALVLGVLLLTGLTPLSLAALHLLFLGWVTMLVYGIGYRLFPFILMRRLRNEKLALLQVACSILGAVLMSTAFFMLEILPKNGQAGVLEVLSIGGVLSAMGAIWFILNWGFAKLAA